MKLYGYRQPKKEKARYASLNHVVECLTKKRDFSCCVRNTYVREIYEFLTGKHGSNDKKMGNRLKIECIAVYPFVWDNL